MTGLGGQSAATDSALVGPERIAWPENGRFRVKNMNDGPKVLNLACGTKMHRAWNNLDPTFQPNIIHVGMELHGWITVRFSYTGAICAACKAMHFYDRPPERNGEGRGTCA